jgi:hypothetical protein
VSSIFRGTLLGVAAFILMACAGESPGPLEGTWATTEPIPVTVSFRPGEAEAMGKIKNVSYKIDGNEVLVTYKDGTTKGTSYRYTVVDANTIRSDSGTFRRVR